MCMGLAHESTPCDPLVYIGRVKRRVKRREERGVEMMERGEGKEREEGRGRKWERLTKLYGKSKREGRRRREEEEGELVGKGLVETPPHTHTHSVTHTPLISEGCTSESSRALSLAATTCWPGWGRLL